MAALLTRICQQPPAGLPGVPACTALRSAWVLDVLRSTLERPLRHTPRMRAHLGRLAPRAEKATMALFSVSLGSED